MIIFETKKNSFNLLLTLFRKFKLDVLLTYLVTPCLLFCIYLL